MKLLCKKILSGCLCASLALSGLMIPHSTSEAAGGDVDIIINGSDVETAAANVNGLTYKGFGVLSANSTSNLLPDYRAEAPEAYNQILKVLFGGEHPIMNHVKIEMGNDGNNSTGADSCTMRYEDEEADASRSPGFVLVADAKKINPDIKVSVLRWEMPNWVQNYWNSNKTTKGYEAAYTWYRDTVFDAYEKYGYLLDYINPDKNETGSPDNDFIKWFKNRMITETEFPDYMDESAREAYRNTKIIASDENVSLNIVPNMRKDSALFDAVDAIGFHYSTGTSSSTADYVRMAEEEDKEVWYSEGCGSFSYTEYQENKNVAYGSGTMGGYQSPIALCDCLVKSAYYSRKTHYIFQPAIGSFYEGSQYDHKELLSAREPWSGHVHFDEALYCLEHFAKFAKTGWENADNTAGIWRYIAAASANNSQGTEHLTNEAGEPSYMTLASPDKKDFSTIVVNNSNKELSYNISLSDMDIDTSKELEVWETATDSYMQYRENLVPQDGSYSFNVAPFSIVTVTSLNCNGKEEYSERLPEESYNPVLDTNATGSAQDSSDNVLYADDFEYKDYPDNYLESRGYEPRYMVDYSGAFMVEDGKLKQKLDKQISQWQNNTPSTVVGDYRWMNYKAGVDVSIPVSGYAGIVVREQTGMAFTDSGYSLSVTEAGKWTVRKRNTILSQGSVSAADSYRLDISCLGNVITAYIDNEQVYQYTDDNAEYFGRVRLFSGWNEAIYDNLTVTKPDESGDMQTSLPYGNPIIDNAANAVKYTGNWSIAANGSSNDWYRSTSKSSSAGASFTFTTFAEGFALIGKNDSSATIDISVNGNMLHQDEKTSISNNHCASYMAFDLGDGKHDVTVTLKSGTFVLDAIMPFGLIPATVNKIEFTQNSMSVDIGKTCSQIPSVLPMEASYRMVYYTSSDESVASVDSVSGEVTGIKAGTATITAKSADGSKVTAAYTVSVKDLAGNKGGDVAQPTQVPIANTQIPATQAPIVNTGSNVNNTSTQPSSSDTNKAIKIKAPKLKSCKASVKKITLKWNKVKNADGYIIMRSLKKKSGFKTIKKLIKNSKVSYIDKKSLKKGKKYYYKVCAYKKSGSKLVKSSFSTVKAVSYK